MNEVNYVEALYEPYFGLGWHTIKEFLWQLKDFNLGSGTIRSKLPLAQRVCSNGFSYSIFAIAGGNLVSLLTLSKLRKLPKIPQAYWRLAAGSSVVPQETHCRRT